MSLAPETMAVFLKAEQLGVLEALLPAIEGIDGQCCVCIEQFVEEANHGPANVSADRRYEVMAERDIETLHTVRVRCV